MINGPINEPDPEPINGPITSPMTEVALPVSWDLPWLPYAPAHYAFMGHVRGMEATDDEPATEGCTRCELAAFSPPDDEPSPEEAYCPEGNELRRDVALAIRAQHIASLQN